HRLLDQVDLARAGALGALLDGALLDLGDAERDADDDARLHQRAAVVRARDEIAEHRFGDLEVGDDAGSEGADRLDVARRTAEHLLGFSADGEHLLAAALVSLNRHDTGLARDDALALDVDQRRRGPEVDREVVAEEAVEPVENHPRPGLRKGVAIPAEIRGITRICPRTAPERAPVVTDRGT